MKLYRAALLSLLLGSLCACESLAPKPAPEPPPPPPPDGVGAYLELMSDLGKAEPAHQSDLLYELEHSYTQAPTTMNSLRYALALATPDQPAFNPAESKKLLEQLLAAPERLSNSENALATTVLSAANAWLKLQADNRRLAATVDERMRAQANSERRGQAQAEEIAKLRKDLDAAQQKLDAIRDIEKSISERSATPPGNKSTRDSASQTQSAAPGR